MSSEIDENFNRRRLLQAGLSAGVCAALPESLAAAVRRLPLIHRAIPSTGQKLPVIGIGSNMFSSAPYGVNGRVGTPYTAVRDVLQRLYASGGTIVDTASAYGDSEVQIGRALDELGLTRKMFIATKFDAPGQGTPNDTVRGQESIERSFERLHKVDLMFIHLVAGAKAMMPLLLDLKKRGRVRYIGLTNVFSNQNHPMLVELMREYPLDFVQVPYSIEDRAIEAEILPLAKARRMAVFTVTPFNSTRDNLLLRTRDRPLPPWAAAQGIASWGQFLLKYAVSHPDITCIATGTTKVEHLVDDLAAGCEPLPNAATRKKMEDYWTGNA